MADGDEPKPAGAAAAPAADTSVAVNADELHAQAVRFLTSVRSQGHSSENEQREFLRSKGLDEDAINRAFKDAIRPDDPATNPGGPKRLTNLPPQDAFDQAAEAFNDPIHAQLPEKTYPKSPLALYYDETEERRRAGAPTGPAGSVESPLTRYQVLLGFFRQLSFLMMLGGGLTAVFVGLYRIYIMPRLIASQDARSILLKHHHDLYDQLMLKVKALRRASPTQAPSLVAAGVGADNGRQLKSALKKVSFSEDTKPAPADDDERSALLQPRKEIEKEKIVVPGSDVVVEAVTATTAENKKEGEQELTSDAEGKAEEDAEAEKQKKIQPIDVTVPMRNSLKRLINVLKADTSAAAAGTPVNADESSAVGSTRSATTPSTPTVEDEDDLPSEEESDEEFNIEDELEFDPFGPYGGSKEKKGKKHGQRTASLNSSTSGSSVPASRALQSSLSGLTATISSQAYMASSVTFNSSFRYSGIGSELSAGLGAGTKEDDEQNKQKAGDISVVKAEIRGLKGLLLSRRNFPSYGLRQNLVPPSNVSQS